MDMPGYDTYAKMYGEGPFSARMGQEDIDLAKMFQEDKLRQQQAVTQGTSLDTMFKQDSYGDRLRQGASAADLAGFNAREQGVKTRISEQTEGLQLDAEQKKLLFSASKADLDGMELEAQRLAYSQNPEEREAGTKLLQMHRDFIKMRAEQGFTAGENAKNRNHQSAMERQRQDGQIARERERARVKSEAGAGDEKLSTDQLRAKYIRLAQEAQAAGRFEDAAMFQDQVRYITQMRASERPDPNANKIDTPAVAGLPAIPPRPPVVPPTGRPPQLGESQRPAAPAALPPGAKQIGTKDGKPVYEINGKRFIVE